MMGDSVSENNGKPQEESESLQNLGNLIGAGTALEDIVNEHKKKETTDRKRVIYARRPDGGKNPELGYTIDEGEPIDVETACVSCIELKIRNSKFGIRNSKLEL